MSTWYPACKVRLSIRLEDNTRGIYPPPLVPTEAGTGAESFGSGSPTGLPAAGEFEIVTQDLVPLECTVELNSYRTADTAKFSIQLSRLPIDPRLVRAISVQVFGGVFSAADFAAANGPKGAAGVMLPDLTDPATGVPTSFGGVTNELFRGFADEIEVSMSADDAIVSMSCRDLSGELLDAEIPPNMLAELPGFLRLDEALQLLLTGDGLADKQQDQRLTEESTKEIGRKRRTLESQVRLLDDEIADAEANDLPEFAAAARAERTQVRAQIKALDAQVEALPPASSRFGLPGFRGLVVVNEVRDVTVPAADGIVVYAELPTVEKLRPKAWLDSRGTVRKGRKKSTGNKAKISFLDFISDIVTSAGYIMYWRPPASQQLAALELVITNPQTHYASSTTAGETFPGPADVRRFTYGSNIEELTLKRSLKGTAVPSVGVKTYDATTGEVYAKIYPPVPKDNRPTPTGDGDRTEIKVYTLDQISGGTPDEIIDKVLNAARSIYEQLSRGDLNVTIKTPVLAGLPANVRSGIVGDLFALRPRDPIELTLPADDPTTGLVSAGLILDDTDVAKRIEQGRLAGLDPESARKLANAASLEYIQREFRTTGVTLTWSTDRGWEFAIAAINYLDIRDSVNATAAAT